MRVIKISFLHYKWFILLNDVQSVFQMAWNAAFQRALLFKGKRGNEICYFLLKENVNIQQNLSIIGAHAEGESFLVAASTFPGGGLFRKIFPLLLLPPGLFCYLHSLFLALKMYFVRLSLNLRFICFLTHSRAWILSSESERFMCTRVRVYVCECVQFHLL